MEPTMRTLRLAASVLALAAFGCTADNRSTIQITGHAAPSGDCKFTPTGDNLLGPGVLDVSYSANLTYGLAVYVKNTAFDPQKAFEGTVTSAKAWAARAAKVRINPKEYVSDFQPSPGLLPFSGENVVGLDGQTIQPGGSAVQGIDALTRPLVQTMIASGGPAPGDIRRIVLGITLEGQTLDGERLDSGEWYFPIDVCNGCLPVPTCTAAQVLTVQSCFGLGQDAAPVCQ
jgi:hypothetical protein